VREMIDVIRAGAVVIVTPDGPRGPRHSMNPGLAWLPTTSNRPTALIP